MMSLRRFGLFTLTGAGVLGLTLLGLTVLVAMVSMLN
jgi:hypothetical protein